MHVRLLLLMALMLLPVAGGDAQAAPDGPAVRTHYLRAHPISSRFGTGYCHIDVPHVHAYAPEKPALYERVDDAYVFVGDPVPFGYDGPRVTWYGHHPVPVEIDVHLAPPPPIFCFIRGPHYHEYAAPPTPEYQLQDSVVFFVGAVPPPVEAVRIEREREYEQHYKPYVAMRPTVVVTPPPVWRGTVWVAPRPVVAGVNVRGPGVHVSGPSIHVGLPSLVIGGPVVREVHHDVYVVKGKKKHHDNGKHKGWYKDDKHHGNGKGKRGHGHD